jgi:hypothetical protein
MEQQLQDWFAKLALTPAESGMDMVEFVLALGASIVFGILLHQLYNLYFRDNEPQDGSLARSLVLLTPSLTATFLMIQSSLSLSLGLLGSLSFVRFRTPVKRAEDVSFIIIAVAVAIALSSGTYILAVTLVALLFTYTVGRNLIGGRLAQQGQNAIITINTRRKASSTDILALFEGLRLRSDFISSRTYDGITSYVFNAHRVTKESHDAITTELSSYDKDAHVNIFYPSDRLGA